MSSNAPRVVGLAFVSSTTLSIVLREHLDLKIYPDEKWDDWLSSKHKRSPVTVLEDRTKFTDAVENCGTEQIIVLAQFDWLEKRGIMCLDAERQEDGAIIKNITPQQLLSALSTVDQYKRSQNDVWLSKSDPSERCGGCMHLIKRCKGDKKPTSKRCDDWKRDDLSKLFKLYSLSQLLHLSLKSANEDALLITPKEVWAYTYQFALGQLTKAEWLSKCGRVLRTVGVPKSKLETIIKWINKNGDDLINGVVSDPPSKLDIKLAKKFSKNGQ